MLRWSFCHKIPPATLDWVEEIIRDETPESYLLRAMLMSTWVFFPPFFDRYGPFLSGLGARFLNLAGKTERTAKKRGKNEQKWARNGLKRVGAS